MRETHRHCEERLFATQQSSEFLHFWIAASQKGAPRNDEALNLRGMCSD